MPTIVLCGGFLRAKNAGLDRALWWPPARKKSCFFWWPPSCKKWWCRACFVVASFVQKIVLFGGFLRAKNGGLDRAFWWPPLCQKSSFSVALFTHKNCAFWWPPSCKKWWSRSCFLVASCVQRSVLFGGLMRAKNGGLDRAFW